MGQTILHYYIITPLLNALKAHVEERSLALSCALHVAFLIAMLELYPSLVNLDSQPFTCLLALLLPMDGLWLEGSNSSYPFLFLAHSPLTWPM